MFDRAPRRIAALVPVSIFAISLLGVAGCGLKLPEVKPVEYERFDLSEVSLPSSPPRPRGVQITDYAVEYTVDLGAAEGTPGHNSEVRVVLPSPLPAGKLPTLVVNGAGAYLFSGMVLADEDIEPMLPYVKQGFAVLAYETDGCQPSFERDPSPSDIASMTRAYVASKGGLVNAKRALDYGLERFPELDPEQLYAIGHSSGGKQALLLAAHDDRIQGCVAFAPACRMDFPSTMTVARIGGPDSGTLTREVNRSMPIAHAKVTKVPLLLVYSPSDRITRPDEVLSYAQAVGPTAKAVPVKCGGHGSVPDAGFPFAMIWLREQCKENRGGEATEVEAGAPEGNVFENPDYLVEGEAPQATESVSAGESETEQAQDAFPDWPPETQPVSKVEPPSRLPTQISRTGLPVELPQGVKRNPFVTE